MFHLPSYDEPLVPGQRVVVFPYPDASGATLGWYGSVVSGRFPIGYRVLFNGREIFVPAGDLLATKEVDDQVAKRFGTVWLRCDRHPGPDQDEIRGYYRREPREWAAFRFCKQTICLPHWEFHLPVRVRHVVTDATAPALHYEVPCAWRLDLPLVIRVFKRLLGKPRHCPPRR